MFEDTTATTASERYTGQKLTKFNNKHKILYFGQENPWHWYRLKNNWQGSRGKSMETQVNEQCIPRTTKPSSIPYCINKSLASKLWKAVVSLYSQLVRPHLEQCIQFGPMERAAALDLLGKGRPFVQSRGIFRCTSQELSSNYEELRKWSQVLFVDTGQEERIQLSNWNRGSFGGDGAMQRQPQVGANFTFYFFYKITRIIRMR